MKSRKVRFYVFFAGLWCLITLGVGIGLYMQYQKHIEKSYTDTLSSVAKLIENQYPEMRDPELLKQRAGTDWFWERSGGLANIKNLFNLAYIYYVEHTDSGYIFLMSSGIQRDEHPEWLGTSVWRGEVPEFIREVYETKRAAYSAKPTSNEWGELVSVAIPIINDGKVAGILGVDYDISYLNSLQLNTQIELAIFLIFAVATLGIPAVIGYRYAFTPLHKQESNERIYAMLDATPLACTFRDKQNKVLECNMEALRMFGVSQRSEFIKRFQSFIPPFQPDGTLSMVKYMQLIQKAYESGYLHFEWMFRTAQDEALPVEMTLVRILWRDTDCLVAYSRDLREIKVNEQRILEADRHTRELEIQKHAAQVASEAKSSFLASMSHEIRTPMNAIIGMSDLMRTDNLDKTQQNYFKDIKTMSYSLLQIINDILDFSKIEAGKLDIIPADYDIVELYENICSLTQFTIAGKALEFRHSIDKNIPSTLHGDVVRVRQVITNILDNAVKYTREGYCDLRIERAGMDGRDYLAIRVEDSGIGIKEEDFPKLFRAFEQVDSKKNSGIIGTGLGLSIAKRLVEMMEGSINFQSEYGRGTTFTVMLPLVEGDAEKIVRAHTLERVQVSPDAKILIVDDNSINLAVAVGYLTKHNARPDTAQNGVTAIEMVRENKYDLVFMDHMMPGMDGIETTRRIRRLEGEYYKKLPIVALSANAVTGAREAFLESGMNDFISKPIKSGAMSEMLLKWLPRELLLENAPTSPDAETKEDDARFDKLLSQLGAINKLSVVSGLSYADGNKSLYVDILSQFCKGLEKDLADINTLKADKNWKDYSIQLHAMKGVLASIGNRFLADQAFELEKASRSGNITKCMEQTGAFCDQMAKFREELLQTSLMDKEEDFVPKKKISAEELAEKLKELSERCLDCDADGADVIASELKAVFFSAETDLLLEEICACVEAFDYAEVFSRYEKLTILIPEMKSYLEEKGKKRS
jgi:signal transduction histidine kinase/CheY-like chemotaxis protein/HPt (histidine-containing phosphotransfer) domain-containing protein